MKSLEMLAILAGMASIPTDLMKDFSRPIRAYSSYNPCFDQRDVRKICSLKYASLPSNRNTGFYQRKTF